MKFKKWLVAILSVVMCLSMLAFVGCVKHEHAFNDGVITTEATYDTQGEITYTCECGETKVEQVLPLKATFNNFVETFTSIPENQGINVVIDAELENKDQLNYYYFDENDQSVSVPAYSKVNIAGEVFATQTEEGVDLYVGLVLTQTYENQTVEKEDKTDIRIAVKGDKIYLGHKVERKFPTLSAELQEKNNYEFESKEVNNLSDILGQDATNNVLATIEALATQIEQIVNDPTIAPILEKLGGLKDVVQEALLKAVGFFTETEYKDEQIITEFTLAKVKALNNTLYTKTLNEHLTSVLGANPKEKISFAIDQLFAITIGDAITALNTQGITNEQIADLLVMVGTSVNPELQITKQAVLESLAKEEVKNAKIAEFIAASFINAESEITPDQALATVKENVLAMIEQFKDKTVYEIIGLMAGEGFQPMMVKTIIDTVIDMIDKIVDVTLVTTNTGKLVSLKTVLTFEAQDVATIAQMFIPNVSEDSSVNIAAKISTELTIGEQVNASSYDYGKLLETIEVA